MANLALFLTDNPVQAHRIRRLLMAIGSTVLVAGVMALPYWHGHMEFVGLVYACGAMLSLSITFYAIFRSGLNLKARDQSLTFPMVLSSILATSLGMYFASDM